MVREGIRKGLRNQSRGVLSEEAPLRAIIGFSPYR